MSFIDRLIIGFDRALRTSLADSTIAERPSPAGGVEDGDLDAAERELSARLMRINHTGEVCAQALYQGQALTAGNADAQHALEKAAAEEVDHLAWCAGRIKELGGHTSFLNPLFYAGSFVLGATAGLAGDRINLGFLAETETQVSEHLGDHLKRLPETDQRSRAIVHQMQEDELGHATMALGQGGAPLPEAIKNAMRVASRVMTETTYRI